MDMYIKYTFAFVNRDKGMHELLLQYILLFAIYSNTLGVYYYVTQPQKKKNMVVDNYCSARANETGSMPL